MALCEATAPFHLPPSTRGFADGWAACPARTPGAVRLSPVRGAAAPLAPCSIYLGIVAIVRRRCSDAARHLPNRATQKRQRVRKRVTFELLSEKSLVIQ